MVWRKGLRSCGLTLRCVSGLAFNNASISTKTVLKISSLTFFSFNTAFREDLNAFIRRSHAPPWCGAAGGENLQRMSLLASQSINSMLLIRFFASWSSLWPDVRFVPLSLNTVFGVPLLPMNRLNASKNEPMSILSVNSKCTARVTKQVNKQPYLFSLRRPIFTK